ncbi:hypothetical protein GN956_G7118 [Arapaima gigas]
MRIPSHLAIIIIISTLCHGSPSPDRECSSEGLAIVAWSVTVRTLGGGTRHRGEMNVQSASWSPVQIPWFSNTAQSVPLS